MIHAELNQERLKGGQCLPSALVDRVLRACARALDVTPDVRISIAFVSPRQMQSLNQKWRGKNRVTDVLSFTLEGPVRGEILLSYEQAKRQAREVGHSTREELCFLMVHGILHIFGYDHETAKEQKQMFTLQERILTSLGMKSRL